MIEVQKTNSFINLEKKYSYDDSDTVINLKTRTSFINSERGNSSIDIQKKGSFIDVDKKNSLIEITRKGTTFLTSSIDVISKATMLNSEDHIPHIPKKPIHERSRNEFIAIVIGGSLLTLNAGFINSVTLQISGVPVSHITGTLTKAGIAIGDQYYVNVYKQLLLVIFFIGKLSIYYYIIYSSSM
jgi:hypothetical protein